jgi:CRP-like cAMP-binding protein
VDVLKRKVQRLSLGDRAAVAAYAARTRWPAGFTIYEAGARADGVFVVVRGRVVLRNQVKAGRGFVPSLAVPGETFGCEGLTPAARYATDARADDEAETLHLGGESFRAFVREQPQRALALVGQVLAERTLLLEKTRELATLGVEQRLLLTLARMSGTRTFTNESGEIVLGPDQYRLVCEMVGATRESVSLVLARLSREGLVEKDGARYVITSPDDLAARLDGNLADREIMIGMADESATQLRA